MQKPRSYAEVYNDLNGDIVNLRRVLQDTVTRSGLTERLVFTPYSREEFELSWEAEQRANRESPAHYRRAHMGFGSAGATKGVTAQSLWATYPEQIAEVV